MTVQEIRGLGFNWPGFDTIKQLRVEKNGDIDLEATRAALLRELEACQDPLEEKRESLSRGKPGWRQDEHAARTAELLRGIRLVEAIIAEANSAHAERRPFSVGRTAWWCLGLALLCGWAAVFLIPFAMRLGMSDLAARRIPIAGAFAGVAVGIAARVAPTARKLVQAILGMIVLAAVLWVCGVFVGGLMFAAGAPSGLADMAPVAGFVLGLMLGLLPLYATVVDAFRRRSG